MTRALNNTRRRKAPLAPHVAELLTMLTYRRPAGSDTERDFIARYLTPLGTQPDEVGNHWLTVGTGSPILWSCHTDTVHREDGMQRVLYGAGVATVKGSNCLGADCTVGVWLMINMIRAGVPGTYVFHRAEEIGGRGSAYIAGNTPARLDGLLYAIAFDRKGYDEIITHQAGGRCASNAFAASLAGILSPLRLRASDGGTFTDTAHYTHLIPECTNLSVGYMHQHTPQETQSIPYALDLLDLLIRADFSTLACQRGTDTFEHDDDPWRRAAGPHVWGAPDLEDYVAHNPASVAAFLADNGYSVADLEDYDDTSYRR